MSAGGGSVLQGFKELMRSSEASRFCCDCGKSNPTQVCYHYGTLVCDICASIHKGAKRRVKPLSSPDLTFDDLKRVQAVGNDRCNRKYLANWDSKLFPQPPVDETPKIKEFLWLKYEGSWVKKKEPKPKPETEPKSKPDQLPPNSPPRTRGHPPQPSAGPYDSYGRDARSSDRVSGPPPSYHEDYDSRDYGSRAYGPQGYDRPSEPLRGDYESRNRPIHNDPYGRPDPDRYWDTPEDPRRVSNRGQPPPPGGEWWARPNERGAAASTYGGGRYANDGYGRDQRSPEYDPRYNSGSRDRYADDAYYEPEEREHQSSSKAWSKKGGGEEQRKKSGKKSSKTKLSSHDLEHSDSQGSEEDTHKARKTKSKPKKTQQLIDTGIEEQDTKTKKSSKTRTKKAAQPEPTEPPPPPPALEADLVGLGPVEYQNPNSHVHPSSSPLPGQAVYQPGGVSIPQSGYVGMVPTGPPSGFQGVPIGGQMVPVPGGPPGAMMQLPPGYVLAPGQQIPPPPPTGGFQSMNLRPQ